MGVRSVSNSNLLMLTERDSWAGIETDNYDFIIYPLTARAPHELRMFNFILWEPAITLGWGIGQRIGIFCLVLFKSSDITVNIHWIKI